MTSRTSQVLPAPAVPLGLITNPMPAPGVAPDQKAPIPCAIESRFQDGPALLLAKQAVDSGNAYQAVEQVSSAATAYTDDAAEGLASFTEKRDPRYRGS
jgi:hypothetical protein